MKQLLLLAAMLTLTICSVLLFACGDDSEDSTTDDDDTGSADPLQTCIDETMRLIGPGGCLYPDTNTQDQIEGSCSQAQTTAGSTDCGTKAFQELGDCLAAIDCSDQDMAADEWNSCTENFDTDLTACA